MVVMDCDLQHPPETVVEMYRLWEDGYEVVEGVKRSRGREGAAHKASAGMFYKIMSKATKIDMSRASDFKLLDRKAVAVLLGMPERNAFSEPSHPGSVFRQLRLNLMYGNGRPGNQNGLPGHW